MGPSRFGQGGHLTGQGGHKGRPYEFHGMNIEWKIGNNPKSTPVGAPLVGALNRDPLA